MGGGADEGWPANRRDEGLDLSVVYKSEDAAAKAGAHDARAVAAFDGPRLFDQRVHRRCRHFEIVAQALVRLLQQPPELFEIATAQRIYECVHARDLGVDVAAPL